MSKRFDDPTNFRVHALMVLAAILVSTSFTVGAAITRGLDPIVLTLVRFALAAAIFGPLVHIRYGLGFSPSLFLRSSLISACLVIFFCCMFLSLRFTSALNTSVIFALVPSISGGYALFINKERLGRGQMLALVCGMVGVLWVIFRGEPEQLLAMQWNRGDLIFLGGCFAMGLYTPLIKRLHRGESMAVMTFWVLVSGSFWLLILAGPRLSAVAWSAVPLFVWLGVAYLAIFQTLSCSSIQPNFLASGTQVEL
jgi:drug/metabolite transporter (DMT)-like permease